jgi:hypothetical protein
MVPLASLLRPWLTTSSSSDSESSTRLHHSSYLVTLLISSSILSGPTFPIVVFSRNLSNRFSHRGCPSRAPIDRGRILEYIKTHSGSQEKIDRYVSKKYNNRTYGWEIKVESLKRCSAENIPKLESKLDYSRLKYLRVDEVS